jgi:hypothetical protein
MDAFKATPEVVIGVITVIIRASIVLFVTWKQFYFVSFKSLCSSFLISYEIKITRYSSCTETMRLIHVLASRSQVQQVVYVHR